MKKIIVMFLCLILVAATLCSTAVAVAVTPEASDIIYFLNPKAITSLDGMLFVADIIGEGQSAIVCFDVTGQSPRRLFTYEAEGEITNLSCTDKGEAMGDDPQGGGKHLYAVFSDKVTEYLVMDDDLATVKDFDVQGAKDFVYGVDSHMPQGKGEYYADSTKVYRKRPSADGFVTIGFGTLPQITGIAAIDKYVYSVYTNADNKIVAQRYDGEQDAVDDEDVFNNANSTPALPQDVKGVFAYNGGALGLFGESRISYIDVGADSCTDVTLLAEYVSDKAKILDVEIWGDTAYILNDQNKIEIYTDAKPNGGWSRSSTIGSEVLERDVPDIRTDLTSFTLVESVGYPGNIVFKTTGGNSVENIVKDAQSYIVLGYDGDEQSNYYYVLYGDKFGWVQKTKGVSSPAEDSKLRVVDTAVTPADPSVSKMSTRFASLGAVPVYPLPRNTYATEEYKTTLQNSASARKEATVLQHFEDGDTVWYYVEYDDGGTHRGFVKKEEVGNFYVTPTGGTNEVVGNYKVNTFLFGTVNVYDNGNPETMDENHLSASQQTGETLKLRSGQHVTVVSVDETTNVAFVEIPHDDGTFDYGYVDKARLIKTTALTTNTAVGLALVGIAIVLAVTLTIVFVRKRKKAHTTNPSTKSESPQPPIAN